MFGYLIANKPELKMKEYDRYRKYYCGVCQALKQNAGAVSQISLSYDLTLVALVLTALYEPETKENETRCLVHGGRRTKYLSNPYFSYAADMNTLLTYYKCIDDWHDDKKIAARTMQLMLKKEKERIKKSYPEKVSELSACMKRIWELEAMEGPVDELRLDDLSVASGRIMQTIFTPYDDIWKQELSMIGFALGKYVYLLDAYDDLEKDEKSGSFNPLSDISKRKDFKEWIRRMLLYTAADATAAFERLPIIEDAELIRNILYAGIWTKFDLNKGEGEAKDE